MLVKFNNSTKDVPVTEVTSENYICPDNEKDTYHVKMEKVKFDPNTGERLSRPDIQKFGQKEFRIQRDILANMGWKLDILHDPTIKAESKPGKNEK